RLVFSTQPVPTTIQNGQSASFTTVPVVQAVDDTGMVDQDYTTNIVLSVTDPNDSVVDGTVNNLAVTSGDHDASATTVTLTPSGGIATYTGLIIQYTNNGSINTLALRATSGSLMAVNSSSINSTSYTAPLFSNLNGGATFTEKGSAVVMDSDVTVTDTELSALNSGLGNYNGASISITRNGGANSVDIFGNSGLLGSLTQGQNFTYNGTTVGNVTTNSGGTLTLTFNSNATSVVVNAVLQSLTYANSSDNPPASVTLNWMFNDGELNSSGSNQAVLSITPVNDAPVISNTSVSKTFNEDSAQTFSAADFGFSDVDSGDTLQSITIVTAPTAGELFIDANNDGVRDAGDTLLGNGSVVSATDLSKLTFRPTANANGTGYASFTWKVSDGTALSANTGTMALNITPVNDVPVISNTSVSKTVNEDSAQTFNPADFGFSDVNSGDTLQSITIVTALTAGELFIDANSNGVRDSGDTLLSNGAVVSAADISKLTFRPTANANGAGYASFTWKVSDGTALSANTGTMTLNVTPVNDAPVISNTSVSKTVNEDSAQTFNPADFGFSDVDSSDTLQSITIVTAPTTGELFIDANNDGVRDAGDTLLGNGSVVSATDISKLTFRPTANANGTGYASFTWKVSDGTALSANTGTMTPNVTPVNDSPTLSSGDPQFRISDGANGSRPVDSRVPTIQSQVAGTPPLN
ncbi:MAG: beta strand repeat-containing protein, partial [Plesiomonas sp.]